jgi:hypothetical protein
MVEQIFKPLIDILQGFLALLTQLLEWIKTMLELLS